MTVQTIHIETPLFENPILNRRLSADRRLSANLSSDRRIWLKMECFQPTGSFKARGIGYVCAQAVAGGQRWLISSSGGNAGYTAAYAGRLLGAKVTVVVPGNTAAKARERMAAEGAEVIVQGRFWDEADRFARQLVAETGAAYIHPFDDPLIWVGHSSLVHEAARQVPAKPDVVVVAVGGGGLLCGLVAGMHEVGWSDVPVLAVETRGADSFAQSVAAGRLVTLPAITSVASTLGAMTVTPKALEWAGVHPIRPVVVTDAEAISACLHFADDMRVLVEPACGAALSLLYDRVEELAGYDNVLTIVCGGAGVTLASLREKS